MKRLFGGGRQWAGRHAIGLRNPSCRRIGVEPSLLGASVSKRELDGLTEVAAIDSDVGAGYET